MIAFAFYYVGCFTLIIANLCDMYHTNISFQRCSKFFHWMTQRILSIFESQVLSIPYHKVNFSRKWKVKENWKQGIEIHQMMLYILLWIQYTSSFSRLAVSLVSFCWSNQKVVSSAYNNVFFSKIQLFEKKKNHVCSRKIMCK